MLSIFLSGVLQASEDDPEKCNRQVQPGGTALENWVAYLFLSLAMGNKGSWHKNRTPAWGQGCLLMENLSVYLTDKQLTGTVGRLVPKDHPNISVSGFKSNINKLKLNQNNRNDE